MVWCARCRHDMHDDFEFVRHSLVTSGFSLGPDTKSSSMSVSEFVQLVLLSSDRGIHSLYSSLNLLFSQSLTQPIGQAHTTWQNTNGGSELRGLSVSKGKEGKNPRTPPFENRIRLLLVRLWVFVKLEVYNKNPMPFDTGSCL